MRQILAIECWLQLVWGREEVSRLALGSQELVGTTRLPFPETVTVSVARLELEQLGPKALKEPVALIACQRHSGRRKRSGARDKAGEKLLRLDASSIHSSLSFAKTPSGAK